MLNIIYHIAAKLKTIYNNDKCILYIDLKVLKLNDKNSMINREEIE